MKKFRCVKCGYEMRKNLKFCPECGQKIEEIDKMDELYTDDKENKAEKTYKFSAMLKRINIKFVIIGGIVLIAAIVFICVFNNNYNKFIRNYNAGKTDVIKESYDKYDDKDIEKIYKYLSAEVHSIRDDYYNDKISYEDAQNELKKIIDSCKSGKTLPDYATCKSDIEKIHNTRNAFQKAQEYYNNGKYENAYDSYKKVESIDDKLYENAQSKMEELKSILAEQYYNSAKDKYEGQAYSTALTDINKAISYNSDEKYQELKEKCQQGESEAKAAKAEEDRQKKLLTPGKEINTSRFNIEYVGAEFTSKILPERTSSAYSYWNCPNDSIYVDLKFYVTNTSDYSANIDFVKNFSASYGKKKYSGSSEGYCELGSNSLDTIFSSTNITPLKKVAYHIAVKLPYEVINTNDSITITFKIDGEEQLLEFR